MAKKKTQKEEAPAPQNPEGVSRFQHFTTETVHRSNLKGAPYNPRHMSQRAKLKLRETLGRVGLVQPIVWNKRTGNIVGGHQRISQLDALEKTSDYSLTVAVVDVDDAREKELNVLLNNPEVCGEWDLEKLKDVLEGIDMINTGFDHAEFMKMFGEAPSQTPAEHKDEVADQLSKIKDAYNKLSAMGLTKDDTDFYNVVVFGSYEERKEFLAAFGFEDNRYIDGRTLLKILFDLKESKPTLEGDKVDQPSVG
jgi:hypothetical protein